MTHAEMLRDRPVLSPAAATTRACPGALRRAGVFQDRHLDRDGAFIERTITLWECDRCGCVIPESQGYLLNAYIPTVCALAEALDVRRTGPLPGDGEDDCDG